MKLFSTTNYTICKPYEIIYADFLNTFIKKLDLGNPINTSRLKKFLSISNLRKLNQIIFYLLDREIF
jgi:hypothetical protein